MSLNPKEIVFLGCLLRGESAKDSALAAGYSQNSAKQRGYELLQKDSIREELDAFYRREQEQISVDRERIRRRLLDMAMADQSKLFDEDWNLLPKNEIPENVQGMVITARRWDSPEQGTGSSAKCISPMEAIKLYLKHFAPPVVDNRGVLDGAAESFDAKLDELRRRLEEDDGGEDDTDTDED